jgi:hypothetical protein
MKLLNPNESTKNEQMPRRLQRTEGAFYYYAVIGTIYLGVAEREEQTSAGFRIATRLQTSPET